MAERPAGPEEPELPSLRRFRFPGGPPDKGAEPAGPPDSAGGASASDRRSSEESGPTEPEAAPDASPRAPADGAGAPQSPRVLPPTSLESDSLSRFDRPAGGSVSDNELSDTFDESDLDDVATTSGTHTDLEYDDATPWVSPLPPAPPPGPPAAFGGPPGPRPPAPGRPGPPTTGPLRPPSTGPIAGLPGAVPPDPVGSFAPPDRSSSRRTALVVAAVAALVAVAAVILLVVKPFEAEPASTGAPGRTAEATTGPAQSAASSSYPDSGGPSAMPGVDPTPGAGRTWAADFCGAVNGYKAQATSLTPGGVNLPDDVQVLQSKARSLLLGLETALGDLTSASTPGAQDFQNAVAKSATNAAAMLDSQGAGPTRSPQQIRDVVKQALAAPTLEFTTKFQDQDDTTKAALYADPSCSGLTGADAPPR